jgi:hypothetical protein
MRRKSFLTMLLGTAAMLVMFLFAGFGTASAQCPGCPGIAPGAGYWVNYNYVYPPAPNGQFFLNLGFANGHVDVSNVNADGHYTYSQDPIWGPATTFTISWAGPPAGSQAFPVPCPKTPVVTPWGTMFIEIKCNPCIEINVSY